ncbi:cupin-like domain-containing protein [Bacillus cereus group sp. N34]|uniref:cupin-like domain-containing protein n=1 Tax=Bacillus cereus group sp. N34 TaxID=2794595 RepID=UPI0018F6004B|nr:cupin-like domain-containing protein [Bacillus cereus group sp. N34]MBJ8018191.1 cupin-like domain-containing protein [Bacillus cereus group sp. N34]
MSITQAIAKPMEIDRRENLTYEEFIKEYAIPRKPVILSGGINSWPAMSKWKPEYLKAKYGSTVVTIHRCTPGDRDMYETTLGEYIDYYLSQTNENTEKDPWYCDWSFVKNCPELLNYYENPVYFKENWTRFIPKLKTNDLRWIFIGPKNTWTPLHCDFAGTSAWNALLSGQKKWVFFPPEHTAYMYDGQVDAFAPNLKKFPEFEKATPLYGIQQAGDIVYTPSGWWHQVRNETHTICVSENFIDRTNYKYSLIPYIKRIVKASL